MENDRRGCPVPLGYPIFPIFLKTTLFVGSRPMFYRNSNIWAPVSEPGFLDFQIFDSRDLFCLQNVFETYVGVISRNK